MVTTTGFDTLCDGCGRVVDVAAPPSYPQFVGLCLSCAVSKLTNQTVTPTTERTRLFAVPDADARALDCVTVPRRDLEAVLRWFAEPDYSDVPYRAFERLSDWIGRT